MAIEAAWANQSFTRSISGRLDDFNQSIELDSETNCKCYLRSIAHQNLNQFNEAQADLQKAIDLAQAIHAKDSDDWGTIANLGLYHLGAGNPVESDRFYRSLLNAPKEMIEMGIKDLEDLGEWRIENDELRIEEAIPLGRLRQRSFERGDL